MPRLSADVLAAIERGLARGGGGFVGGSAPTAADVRLFNDLLGDRPSLHRWISHMGVHSEAQRAAWAEDTQEAKGEAEALFALVGDDGHFRDEEATREWREKWRAEQLSLRDQLVVADAAPWCQPGGPPLRRVAGVDISFARDSDKTACASLVVMDITNIDPKAPEKSVLYEATDFVTLELPYICGFLAFREVPHLQKLIDRLRADRPDCEPDLVIVDGSGVLHPVGFGCASHLGVVTGLPTVGVAKNFLAVDGMELKPVLAKCREPGVLPDAGSVYPLVGDSGRQWGMALRATKQSTNPIFVSAGHLVSNETAAKVVAQCCGARVPEPVRQADLRSRAFLRERGLL